MSTSSGENPTPRYGASDSSPQYGASNTPSYGASNNTTSYGASDNASYGAAPSTPPEQPAPEVEETQKPTYSATSKNQYSAAPTYSASQYSTGGGYQGGSNSYATKVTGTKSYIAALLMSIFLGGFGVVDFYLGYMKRGLTKVAFFFLGSVLPMFLSYDSSLRTFLFLFSFALSIWCLITIIMVAARIGSYGRDADGAPLK